MLEHQLEVSEQQKQSLDERLKEVEEEKRQLQRDAQSKELELASHLEELRAKVGKHTDIFPFANLISLSSVS